MLMAVFLLTACGKDDDAVSTAAATTCQQAGYVSSASYGCIPQGYCPTGYGTYNNQCVQATVAGSNTCQAGYVWNGSTCVYSGAGGVGSGDPCPYIYPGSHMDPNRYGWCTYY
jgi:hypothetical protein